MRLPNLRRYVGIMQVHVMYVYTQLSCNTLSLSPVTVIILSVCQLVVQLSAISPSTANPP